MARCLDWNVESGRLQRFRTVAGGFTAYQHEVTIQTLGIEFPALVFFAQAPEFTRNFVRRSCGLIAFASPSAIPIELTSAVPAPTATAGGESDLLTVVGEEFLLQIRPEFRHQVAHRAAHQTGPDPAEHYRAAHAGRRIIEVRRRDSQHHTADA
jgi:hypothetical protein